MKGKITIDESFQAMIKFLEKYYNFTKSDDIGSLLGGMDTSFWENGKTFDPALWQDWVESVNAVIQNTKEKNK